MGTKGQTIDDLDDLDYIVALNKKIFYIDSCGGVLFLLRPPPIPKSTCLTFRRDG